MSDQVIDILSNMADTETPVVETETAPPAVEAVSETPPEAAAAIEALAKKVSVSDEEVRAENLRVLQEKRANLAAQREYRKQKTDFEGRSKGVDEARGKYEAEMRNWSESFKDPKAAIKAFQDRGVDPYTLHQILTDGLLGETTPEAQQKAEAARLQKETLDKVNPEVAALKKQIAEMEAWRQEQLQERQRAQEAQAAQTQKMFVDYLKEDPATEELFDWYTEDQVLAMGNSLSEALTSAKLPNTFKDLRQRMLVAHNTYVKGLEEKRNARKRPIQSENSSETKSKSKNKTIDNSLATATASVRPTEETRSEESARGDLARLLRLE